MKNMNSKRILLADNSSEYRRSVIAFLELEGYAVVEAGSPKEAQTKLELAKFDIVLADLRMQDDEDPNDMSGLEIAKFASENGVSCIIVTAFPTVELARIALRSRGAEPYAKDLITKASGAQALLDSISLTLRNRQQPPEKADPGGLTTNLEQRLVRQNGIIVKLSKNQYTLLAELHKKDGGVSTYAELIKSIYDETLSDKQAANDKRLRNLVDRTKLKIEDQLSEHVYIEVVSGRGYRLNLKT
jgi:two-component system KDP operon response regulator KdpE